MTMLGNPDRPAMKLKAKETEGLLEFAVKLLVPRSCLNMFFVLSAAPFFPAACVNLFTSPRWDQEIGGLLTINLKPPAIFSGGEGLQRSGVVPRSLRGAWMGRACDWLEPVPAPPHLGLPPDHEIEEIARNNLMQTYPTSL